MSSSWSPRHALSERLTGDVSGERLTRLTGGDLRCSGVHLADPQSPPDPSSPLGQFWAYQFEAAMADWAESEHPEKNSARAAWKAVSAFWDPSTNSFRPLPRLRAVSPPLEDMVNQGVLLEVTGWDQGGNRVRWDASSWGSEGNPPALLWSPERSSLVVKGRVSEFPCRPGPVPPALAREYERWHGRAPRCAGSVSIPPVDVDYVGQVDGYIYRSDKWEDHDPDPAKGRGKTYYHQTGPGVGIFTAAPRRPGGGAPELMLITGGCHTLHERGMVH